VNSEKIGVCGRLVGVMKSTRDHSLFLGLVASLLLTLGLVSLAERVDAVMNKTDTGSEDQLKVAGPPAMPCINRANDDIG